MSLVKSYLNQFLAFTAGDEDGVKAVKSERVATAIINARLAAITGLKVSAEVSVEEAEDSLAKAIVYNCEIPSMHDSSDYLNGLIDAKSEITKAKDELEDLEEEKVFLEEVLNSFKDSE